MMIPKAKGKNKGKNTKNRKIKINLVFNEENRRDFLTGFHKRKLQRKKKAKEKLEQELKEERKRLKAEAKESYKKLIKSHTPVPEVEDLLTEEYDDDDVNVKVVELSATEIAKQNNWIGTNKPSYESGAESKESGCSSGAEDEVPGMELNPKLKKVREEQPEGSVLKSKKEIKKILKKQATKNVQKSKAFKMKNKLEKQKQKKKAIQKKKLRIKLQNKCARKKAGRKRQS